MAHNQAVKMVGINGQVSLGKEFAGKVVLIDQVDSGIWIIKSGTFVPDSEQWLYSDNAIEKIDKALAWAEKTKPKDNFERMVKSIKK